MSMSGIGFAISGACNLLNGKWQRDFQRDQNEYSRELQHQEREADRAEKRELERERAKRDDDRYDEKSMWPFAIQASTINRKYEEARAKGLNKILVLTAVSGDKIFDEVSNGAWKKINAFLDQYFKCRATPTVDFKIGQYSAKVEGQEIDVQAIYSLIPTVPTILIAPQISPVEEKHGFLVAVWGNGISASGPIKVKDLIDFDFKHHYVESIRRDTNRFPEPKKGERSEIRKNRAVFEEEKAKIAEMSAGEVCSPDKDWVSEIDEQYSIYDGLVATTAAKTEIQNKVEELFKLFFTVVVDSYFVCSCDETPLLPAILSRKELKVETTWDRHLIGYYATLVVSYGRFGVAYIPPEVATSFGDEVISLGLKDEGIALKGLITFASEDKKARGRIADAAVRCWRERRYDRAVARLQMISEYEPKAMCNLGVLSREGLGCRKNADFAEQCFRKAANSGFYPAYAELATLYERSGNHSEREIQDLLLEAAENGVPDAQYRLAEKLVEKGDEMQAKKWLKKAAFLGHRTARDVIKATKIKNGDSSKQTWLDKFERHVETVVETVVDLGESVVAYICNKLHISEPSRVERVDSLTFDDLEDFATQRKYEFPDIKTSYLAFIKKGDFVEVLQLMMTEDGPKKVGRNCVGRRLIARQVDGKISALMSERDVSEHFLAV